VIRSNLTTVLVLSLATGCSASAVTPKAVDEARALMARPETGDLERQRPKLVGEAKTHLDEANAEAARGQTEQANLHATIAVAKYKTAKNFVLRDELTARRRAAAANESGNGAEKNALSELDERIARLESSGAKTPALTAARATLSRARDKQAEAIREGAPTRATARYEEGRRLVELAVEELSTGSAETAPRYLEQAITAFDLAIEETKRGQAPAPVDTAARSALQRAEDARAEALGRDVPTRELARPDALLENARRALSEGDRDRAIAAANDARTAYMQAGSSRQKAPVPIAPPTSSPDSGVRALADQRILELELRRAELVGKGRDETCKAGFKEFESTLDIAKSRLREGDAVHALEIATRAGERLRACDPPVSAQPATRASEQSHAADAARTKTAAAALQKAHEQRIRAELALGDDRRLERAAAALAKAEQWFERAGYEQAEVYARQAEIEYGALASAKEKDKDKKAAAPTATPNDAAALATKAILSAQEKLARVGARHPDDPAVAEARGLIDLAEKVMARGDHETAKSLATKASQALDGVKGETDADKCGVASSGGDDVRARVSPIGATNTAQERKARDEALAALKDASTQSREGKCEAAMASLERAKKAAKLVGKETSTETADPSARVLDKLKNAERVRDTVRVDDANRTAFERASDRLRVAKDAYARRAWGESESNADAALGAFEAMASVGATGAVAKTDKDKASDKQPKKEPEKSAPKEPATKEPEKVAVVAPAPGATSPAPTTAAWGQPYKRIQDALAARAEALAVANDDDRAALDTAEGNMGRARGAWSVADYPAADSYAQAALSTYGTVIAAAKKRAQKNAPADSAVAAKEVDAAMREASFALDDCQREACDDRDAAAYSRGKRLYEAAQQASDGKDHAYAHELARESLKMLRAALATPRKNAPKDPKEIARARQAADDALREAAIQMDLCKGERCETFAAEDWTRGTKELDGAKDALQRQDHELTKSLAERAATSFKAALSKAPKLTVPPGVTHVRVEGKQLIVSPQPDFANGTAKLSAQSTAVVKDLAAVLRANKDLIARVSLTGHTDNVGNAAQNTTLSRSRAQSIATALQAEGISSSLLAVDGKGSSMPIADNATDAGRKANRRVEINFEFK